MTQQLHAHTAPFLPVQPESLEAVVADLTALWREATQAGLRLPATEIFASHPGANQTLSVALEARAALRTLLAQQDQPDDLPVVSEGEGGGANADADEREDGEADEEPASGDGEGPISDEEATPSEAGPTPTPGPRTSSAWPHQLIGTGFLSGLAATLGDGEGLQLNLTRVQDELIVVITPRRVQGEPGETAMPLKVTGTPAELDADLLAALPLYGSARQSARDAANELLKRTQQAALKAQQAKPTSGQKACQTAQERAEQQRVNAQASLIAAAPEGSVITLTSATGATQVLTSGLAVKLDAQKVTLNVELAGHEPYTATFSLRAREQKRLTATLKPLDQSSLF